MKPASERELRAFFGVLDERLGQGGFEGRVTVYVFGGAAAVIAYGSARATLDIDAYVDDRAIERQFLEWAGEGSTLARMHGLYFQSAHTELMLLEEPEWKERSIEILAGALKRIRVRALGREDLILSKLSRYNDRDRADILFLAESGKVDPNTLIARYKSARLYYVGSLTRLDSTFNLILGEHFGLGPFVFE